ncbi:MAG TPA: hypothetical protein VH092_22610 [Urbifossiella sp.]|nr:hypothetical protein [Urbifossiella sp.]
MPAVRSRPGITSVATLGGFVLTVGLAQLTAPEWSRAAGLDVWHAADARQELALSLADGERIDASNQHIHDQIQVSAGIVARVAAGQLSLAAAVDELDQVNADRTAWVDGLRFAHSAVSSHRHRVAWYVIKKLESEYAADPSAWAPVAARLAAEYRAMQG